MKDKPLFVMLLKLWTVICNQKHSYFIMHICSHTSLPGFFVEGNSYVDSLVAAMAVKTVLNVLQQAVSSHQFFHQGAQALQKQFKFLLSEAKSIISSCPDCHMTHISQYYGTNPRRLLTLQEWQTDITKMPEFGHLKYVYVIIDTFAHAMVASALAGETAWDVICHFCHAFYILGVPSHIKTDNGLAYVSQKLQTFFCPWGVDHSTGISHTPTGQAIIECAYGVLKSQVQKQKEGMQREPPQVRLDKAVYMLNFLCPLPDSLYFIIFLL